MNAATSQTRYVLVMGPETAALVDELHQPDVTDYAAVFERHASKLLRSVEERAILRRVPPAIGDRARRTRIVTEREIELFTELTGDRNPLHYDTEVASRTRFGGIIVQGGVTSGLLNAVVAEDLPGPGSVFLHVDWSFKAPVRPGDELTAEVEVLEAREDKPITRLRTTVTKADGTVVLDGEALVWHEPV